MASMEAFALSSIPQTSFLPARTTAKSPRRCRSARQSPPSKAAVPRRQRLRACEEEAPKTGKRPEDSKDDDDNGASDLALPDLRQLFEAAGRPDCEQCEGRGTIVCPVCTGEGFVSLTMMETVSSAQCRMCRGKRDIPCPTCREEVYKSVLWWDLIPSPEEDPDEKWREGPDGEPRIRWGENPAR